MRLKLFHLSTLASGLALLMVVQVSVAQPACKGPNKNDPGCPGAEEPPPPEPGPVQVNSASVDWAGESIILRGAGFDVVPGVALGDSGLLTVLVQSDTELEVEFGAQLAAAVPASGNYQLFVNGAGVLSLYFEAAIVDPAAGGCPCAVAWGNQTPGWGVPHTTCVELQGVAPDIAGTVLTDSADSSVYPHFPIGAAYSPATPASSVCRLTQVDGDLSVIDLVNQPINATQQGVCADLLKANVCATVIPGS